MKRLWLLALALTLSAFSTVNHALVIHESRAFANSTATAGGTSIVSAADPGFALFNRFDTTLGDLTRVSVSISGTSVFSGSTAGNINAFPGNPVGYGFTVDIAPDFGLWNAGIGATQAGYHYVGNSSGIAIPFDFSVGFEHSFSIDEVSELVGFGLINTIYTPGGSIPESTPFLVPPVLTSALTRSDFQSPIAGVALPLIFPTQSGLTTGIGSQGPVIANVTTTGEIALTYEFEERNTSNPNIIPEPTTLALMGLGLAGIGRIKK